MAETLEDAKMSFFDHLTELRGRIVWSLVGAGIGLLISLVFAERIIRFISRPLSARGTELVFVSLTEGFWTYMKVAMVSGLFIASPIVLWNVWAFVAPGLHRHERKYAGPFVIVGSVLFLLGGAFALLVIVPYATQFLLNFGEGLGLRPMITLQSYVDFVLKFSLAFGLVFEMPVIITLLSLIGVVTPEFLSKNRKYAILINFVIAAILTPTPDAFNQSLMAGPLIMLYEVGILSARLFRRRRNRAAAAAAEPRDGSGDESR